MSNGLNDYAENTDMRVGLRKEFPPALVSKLPATQKRPALDYVSHAAVTDRLNKEAPGWTFELERFIEFTDDKGLPHIMAVYGYMQIGSVRRYEVGEADGLDNYGRELKGAISDFIRRAAMRFGVALDLWSKEALIEEESSPPSEVALRPPFPSQESSAAQGTGVSSEAAPVPTPSGAEAAQATTGGTNHPAGVATTSASASETVAASVDAAASGGAGEGRGEGPDPVSPAPLQQMADGDQVATSDQWERLRAVCGDSMQKAVNRLNKVNGTAYTKATAVAGATRQEVANAITGSAAA